MLLQQEVVFVYNSGIILLESVSYQQKFWILLEFKHIVCVQSVAV